MRTVKASEVFDREFLALRGKLLEVAAGLDRIARAEGAVADPRMGQLRRCLAMIAADDARTDRAEQMQMLLSLPYDPEWRKKFAQ